jgi:hypothetical protein
MTVQRVLIASKRSTGRSPEWLIALICVVGAFLFWKMDWNFFWRDDWDLLARMRHPSLGMLMENHFGHVIPVFKLSFYLQLRAFGTNAIWFSYVNLLAFGMSNYMVHRLARRFTTASSAWVVVSVLTMHPIMFSHLTWTFQQCITFHILFQVLAVLYFLDWVLKKRGSDFARSLLFTALQNYCFGNGLFLPMLFVIGIVLFRKGALEWRFIVAYLMLEAAFILVQLFVGGARGTSGLGVAALPAVVSYGLCFLGFSMSRIFLIREWVMGSATPWICGGAFIAFAVMAFFRKDRDRRYLLFHMVWFSVAFCSIPIAVREGLGEAGLPHYYSVLSIIPMAFIVEHALGGRGILQRVRGKTLVVACSLAVLLVFYIDQQLKDTASFRSFRNQQLMFQAIQDGTPYEGFDDPYFRDGRSRVGDAREVYAYWRQRDLFRPAMGYTNNEKNWTRSNSLYTTDRPDDD